MVAWFIQIMQKHHNAPFSRSANRRVANMLHCLQQSIVKEEAISVVSGKVPQPFWPENFEGSTHTALVFHWTSFALYECFITWNLSKIPFSFCFILHWRCVNENLNYSNVTKPILINYLRNLPSPFCVLRPSDST